MAITYAYPVAQPANRDLLLATKFIQVGEKTTLKTVTFTVSSLAALIAPSIIDNDNFVRNTADIYLETPKITQAVTLSLSQYNNITTKQNSTLYVII